jgi:hypothetical protein
LPGTSREPTRFLISGRRRQLRTPASCSRPRRCISLMVCRAVVSLNDLADFAFALSKHVDAGRRQAGVEFREDESPAAEPGVRPADYCEREPPMCPQGGKQPRRVRTEMIAPTGRRLRLRQRFAPRRHRPLGQRDDGSEKLDRPQDRFLRARRPPFASGIADRRRSRARRARSPPEFGARRRRRSPEVSRRLNDRAENSHQPTKRSKTNWSAGFRGSI